MRFEFSAEANAAAGASIETTAVMGEATPVMPARYSSATNTAIKAVAVATAAIVSAVTAAVAIATITVAIVTVPAVAIAIVVIFSGAGTIVRAQGIGWLRCYAWMGVMNTVEICILRECACAK